MGQIVLLDSQLVVMAIGRRTNKHHKNTAVFI